MQTSYISNREAVGIWDVKSLFFYQEDDQTTRYIEGHLTEVSSGHKTEMEWRNLLVRKKKMSYTENRGRGTYWYKLKRL